MTSFDLTLSKNTGYMIFHRVKGDKQLYFNLLIGFTIKNQQSNLLLSFGKFEFLKKFVQARSPFHQFLHAIGIGVKIVLQPNKRNQVEIQ